MILVATFKDGTEDAVRVSENTKLRELQKNGYWTFSTIGGGQVALAEEDVVRVEVGNVEFADDRGRVEATGTEAP